MFTTRHLLNQFKRKFFQSGTPNLSSIEISKILQKNQKSLKIRSNVSDAKDILRIDSSSVGSNVNNEDSWFQRILDPDEAVFLGVLDGISYLLVLVYPSFLGHWDADCSRHASIALPNYLQKIRSLSQNKSLEKADLVQAFLQLDRDILRLPWRLVKDLDSMSIPDIKSLDKETRWEVLRKAMPAFTGSCALVTHIKDSQIHIAHAGDCRAVLGSFDPFSKSWKARALTEDHQPSNLRELSRLQNEHPGEEDTVAFSSSGNGPLRVLGGLMPSRAFGDARYKWSLEDQEKIDALLSGLPLGSYSWLRPHYLQTPPYMTAKPDIATHKITELDQFLVISTDGLFDVFTNRDIVRHLSNYLKVEDNQENAATYLIRCAIENGKGQEFLSQMLSMEPKESRKWRDDMTVQVVFFKSSKVSNYDAQYLE